MYKRAEYQIIRSRLEEERRFIQVVMGARQIGKSTVVKQVLKDLDAPYQLFSADNVPATNSAWIANCWAAVRSLKASRELETIILVIDEIQKIANWSEVACFNLKLCESRDIYVICIILLITEKYALSTFRN